MQKQRHPPGLRGKAIGLYYRDRNRQKHEKEKIPSVLKLSTQVEEKLKTILSNSKTFFNSVYNDRSSERGLDSVHDNKYHHIGDSQFKRRFLEIINGDIQHNLIKAMKMPSKLQRDREIDKRLLNEYKEKQIQSDYLNMLKFRTKLPAFDKRSEILQLIDENQVIVVSGETGSLQKLIKSIHLL